VSGKVVAGQSHLQASHFI